MTNETKLAKLEEARQILEGENHDEYHFGNSYGQQLSDAKLKRNAAAISKLTAKMGKEARDPEQKAYDKVTSEAARILEEYIDAEDRGEEVEQYLQPIIEMLKTYSPD